MRYELNDYEWRVIKPMLPNPNGPRSSVEVLPVFGIWAVEQG